MRTRGAQDVSCRMGISTSLPPSEEIRSKPHIRHKLQSLRDLRGRASRARTRSTPPSWVAPRPERFRERSESALRAQEGRFGEDREGLTLPVLELDPGRSVDDLPVLRDPDREVVLHQPAQLAADGLRHTFADLLQPTLQELLFRCTVHLFECRVSADPSALGRRFAPRSRNAPRPRAGAGCPNRPKRSSHRLSVALAHRRRFRQPRAAARHRIASRRARTFIKAHWNELAATDFLSVEVWTPTGLKTHYVLFLMELRTRRVYIAEGAQHRNPGDRNASCAQTSERDGRLGKAGVSCSRDSRYGVVAESTRELRSMHQRRSAGLERL